MTWLRVPEGEVYPVMRKVLVNFPFWIGTKPAERLRKELEPAIEKKFPVLVLSKHESGSSNIFPEGDFWKSPFFFPLSKILNPKIHANMLRRIRLVRTVGKFSQPFTKI
jgi:hypothetical protein